MIRDIGSDYQVGYLRLVNSKDRQTITFIQVHLIGRSRPKPCDRFVRDIESGSLTIKPVKISILSLENVFGRRIAGQLANVEA